MSKKYVKGSWLAAYGLSEHAEKQAVKATHCGLCFRPLKSPASVRRGYGGSCWRVISRLPADRRALVVACLAAVRQAVQ